MNPVNLAEVLVIMALVVGFGWLVPIVCGILVYQHKGYSPHWMWFGVHPVGGWIALLVGLALRKRGRCPDCGGYVEPNFWLCPYCGHELVRRRSYPFADRFQIELPEKLPPRSVPQPEEDQGLFTEKRPASPDSDL